MRNILFYKYVKLGEPDMLRKKYSQLCKSLDLKGTVLIAEEGINGCLTGDEKKMENFKEHITSDERFSDMEFKEAETNVHGFKKLKVKVKKEIVTSGVDVNLSKSGKYIEPKELKQLFDSNEDFVMVDMRNRYESEIGVFDKSIVLKIDNFREVPSAMSQLAGLQDKKIVAYCTGGVRCEKGSAFLKRQNFKNVFQLHGGILKYGKEVGNRYWNGKCFVFDDRVVVDIDPENESEPISKCVLCKIPNAHYDNCKLVTCDKRSLSCESCFDILKGCCSKKCRGDLLKRNLKNKIKVSL